MEHASLPHHHRDHGPREDRQKARMIWLVEALGEQKWKELIEQYMGGVKLRPAVKVCAVVDAVCSDCELEPKLVVHLTRWE